MVFKDQAQGLVTPWEQETARGEYWHSLVFHTAVVLSADPATPPHVLEDLDAVLTEESGRARAVFRVVAYLRLLAARADVEPTYGPQVLRLR